MVITNIIQYEGDNHTFVWKHPSENFNCFSQLIVHESQEALFFSNGKALDLFQAGRHTLKVANIPFLRDVIAKFTDDDTPFHCEVYYINKAVQMAVKWGTDSKVRYIDPDSGIPLQLGACGEMNLQVCDSRKLVTKLVGTTNGIAWGEQGDGFTKSLQSSFRPLISTAVKSNLTAAIKALNIDILEVDEHLTELSETLRQSMLAGFEEYGLTIPQFYLTTVVLPEEDPNFKRIRELHTISLQTRMAQAEATVMSAKAKAEAEVIAAKREAELERQTTQTEIARRAAERELIEAQAKAQAAKMEGFAEAEIMRAKGYNEKDVMARDVQIAYAEGIGQMGANGGGGGSAMSDIVGLGIGLQAAGVMGGQVSQMFQNFSANSNTASAPAAVCAKCGSPLPENAKFCLECGEKVVSADTVVCPGCGNTVVKRKFCPECGYKFDSTCPKCGASVDGGKFCPECGEKL